MKVLVTGGRDYKNRAKLFRVLDDIHAEHGIELIIEGGAFGADQLAGEWAGERCVPCLNHPANWEKHGRTAGPIRNGEMLRWKPDLIVAFPGGHGTANMVGAAKRVCVPVRDERSTE